MTISPGKDYEVLRVIETVKGEPLLPGTLVTVIGSETEFAEQGIVKFVIDGTFGMVEVELKEELWYSLKEITE